MGGQLRKIGIISSIVVILSAGCEKDKTVEAVDENLVGRWIIENVTFKSATTNKEIVIIDDVLKDCQQDDIVEFFDGGRYYNSDSDQQCDPTSNDEGRWDLRNGRTLRLNGFDYDLISLKRSTFVIADSSEMNGNDGQIKLYFKRY
jgi:hypothetical protein